MQIFVGNERQRMLATAAKFIKTPAKDEVKDEVKEEMDENDETQNESDYTDLTDEDISGSEEDMDIDKEIKTENEEDDELSFETRKKPERKLDTATEEGRVLFLR